MKEYEVEIEARVKYLVYVDAENKEEALSLALNECYDDHVIDWSSVKNYVGEINSGLAAERE